MSIKTFSAVVISHNPSAGLEVKKKSLQPYLAAFESASSSGALCLQECNPTAIRKLFRIYQPILHNHLEYFGDSQNLIIIDGRFHKVTDDGEIDGTKDLRAFSRARYVRFDTDVGDRKVSVLLISYHGAHNESAFGREPTLVRADHEALITQFVAAKLAAPDAPDIVILAADANVGRFSISGLSPWCSSGVDHVLGRIVAEDPVVEPEVVASYAPHLAPAPIERSPHRVATVRLQLEFLAGYDEDEQGEGEQKEEKTEETKAREVVYVSPTSRTTYHTAKSCRYIKKLIGPNGAFFGRPLFKSDAQAARLTKCTSCK